MRGTRTRIGRLAVGAVILAFLDGPADVRGAPRRPADSRRSAPDLVGTEWVLEDLCGRKVLDGVRSTIAFPERGRIAGKSGCNRYSGPVRITRNRIEVHHLASTRMACPQEVMDQEARFLDALQKARRIEMDGPALLIHGDGCAKALRFTRLGEGRQSSRSQPRGRTSSA